MSKTWFTSDLHLGHKNIIRFCNRPFKTIEEMDEILMHNWNKVVDPEDTIYILGDFCWRDMKKYLDRLNGNKHLIKGSHDKQVANLHTHFVSVSDMLNIVIEEQRITLCHYAMRVWNASHYNCWQLYGHSHGRLEPVGKQMDVGVDCNDFHPISFEDIQKVMRDRPDNFNLVKREGHMDTPSEGGFKEVK